MARVLKGSQCYLHTPRSSVNRMNHTCRYRPQFRSVLLTDLYEVPDAVPPIHAVYASHVATDKEPSKFRSIFSDNLQPIATRRKIARGTLLVDIGCSSERAPLPPPLVITTKLAAAIYGGAANNKYKYSIQYCPCGFTLSHYFRRRSNNDNITHVDR